ncbi:MAG TPA: DUF6531 domain-containing protein [Duganella sp.]|nr:DUF6531 domain-containing protein [Duganella sp.]
MKNWRACVIGLGLLCSVEAKADLIPVIGNTNFRWVGNYQTAAGLYAACTDLVTSLKQDAKTWCGAQASPENPDSFFSINAGWIQDRSQPNSDKFYLLGAYACLNNDSVRYFSDTMSCSTLAKMTMPVPSSPKANGASCPANPQNRQPSCGNPIAIGTGNKVQLEVDYGGNTPGLPLSLTRTYNGGVFTGYSGIPGSLGSYWSQPSDRRLRLLPNRTETKCFTRNSNSQQFCESVPIANAPPAVSVLRPDGKVYTFTKSGGQWLGDADVDDRLSARYAADGVTPIGWTYVTAGQDIENYDDAGRLVSIASRAGATQRYTYSSGNTNDTGVERLPSDAPVCSNVQQGAAIAAGLPVCVTDHWGRQLQFEYDGKSRIVKALDPAGSPYLYSYDGPSSGCLASAPTSLACKANNLTQVTYPDGKKRVYYYNESARINGGSGCSGVASSGNGFGHLLNSLTGIVDENGGRFATWGYDCAGRAISSEHAGGVEKVQISYGARNTDGTQTTTVTSAIGTAAAPATIVRSYHSKIVLGVSKNDALNQPCAGCDGMLERTYDGNGNVLSGKDWNGSKTVYTYDSTRNLETSRTEASGTASARTTTTSWHATLRLPIKIAAPLRITTFEYDAAGNVLGKSEQTTNDVSGVQGLGAPPVGTARNWSYTYNDVGQPLTVTGPLNDKISLSYDSEGNLASVTNAAQHVTTYSNYDAAGRVGKITDPNGLVTDLGYTSRGWLSSSSVGGEVTSYDYDGVGQLIKATLADGSTLSYAYDSAHRLTGITDGVGNSIVYTLDLVGNRVAEQVKDAGGTLARKIGRVYNPLNRLTQITGASQ